MKISKRNKDAFDYFSQCLDSKRMPSIPYVEKGLSALFCFSFYETHGKIPHTNEPELLGRALNGKVFHGVTVTMLAEDYIDRILFADELDNYPGWVRKDILGRARQLCKQRLGFIPAFVQTGKDFTNSSLQELEKLKRDIISQQKLKTQNNEK